MTTMEGQLRLLCEAFINKHQIGCAESIYQRDSITEDAPYLVQDICELVGYVKTEDDEP